MENFRPPLRPRVGLVGKFAFASLVPILLLGLVLAHVLRSEIRGRALLNARQSAALLDQSLVQPQLSPTDLRIGLSKARVRALDRTLQASLAGKQIARIKVWNHEGRAVYASDHAMIGEVFPPSDELRTALGGETASEVSDLQKAENARDRGFGQLLEVYTPLRFQNDGQPAVLGRHRARHQASLLRPAWRPGVALPDPFSHCRPRLDSATSAGGGERTPCLA